MYIHDILKRQSTGPPGSQFNNEGDNNTSIPTYVWIVVVIFVALALTCGICARRNYRRQYLYREQVLRMSSNRPPTILPWARPFPGPGESIGDLRPPPRARRRASQTSITSLPVYNERPGEREVVLLQRTGPKEQEGHASPPPPPVSPDNSRNTHETSRDTDAPIAERANSVGTRSTAPLDHSRSTTESVPPTANLGEASAPVARPSSPPPPFSSTNPFKTRSNET